MSSLRDLPRPAAGQPVAVHVFLRCGDATVVGASPEVMVRLEGGTIDLRPIAGTRRRGATEEEDTALAAELLADPKERPSISCSWTLAGTTWAG